jgi:hypothetical protein
MPELRHHAVIEVDVATDPDVLERYGARIPVLVDAERELAWPFNADDVATFVTRSA